MTEQRAPETELWDFTATARLVPISFLSVFIGAFSALVALALLRLIGLFTNLFFFQRAHTALVSPEANTLGVLAVLVPVSGALIIGLMARYGSERIRGHGIPEALEAILTRGSRVEPLVAVLKPISAAISIGSGGPFGAEGPIVMTGGAFGSLIAQLFRLTAAERKTLLVAGAAAGMSATFSAPMASVLLAVELLLFELKPRSFIPVALASATALAVRIPLLGRGAIFPLVDHVGPVGARELGGAALVGLAAGVLSVAMTLSVYFWEDAFKKLPIHWMWWPAIGAVAIGVGGLVEPRALGVGYGSIAQLLHGGAPVLDTLRLATTKWAIWSVALGSGTSGGVLAPLLMLGSALGNLLAPLLPAEPDGFWPLLAMGAIVGGTMRAPLTGTVFALELTGSNGAAVPLLVAVAIAHGFTVLTMRRSILTEKVARRGFHITREYSVDPLEVLFVRDVMQSTVVTLPSTATAANVAAVLATDLGRLEPLYSVLDGKRLVGVATRRALSQWATHAQPAAQVDEMIEREAATASPSEPLATLLARMAETGVTQMPVVDPEAGIVVGSVSLANTLKAKRRHVEEETRRERIVPLGLLIPSALRSRRTVN